LVSADDTTPPTTTIILDPPAPTGLNGWYITDVTITLYAVDNESGVNTTYYRLNNDTWVEYTEPFNISTDGIWEIDYYSVDFAGNQESLQNTDIKIDETKPEIDLTWEHAGGNYIVLSAYCNDKTSGMDYVEFYRDEFLLFTDDIAPYECITTLPNATEDWHVSGLILLKQMNETTISVFAIFVIISSWGNQINLPDLKAIAYDIAGNEAMDCLSWPGERDWTFHLKILTPLTLINDYIGTITRFRINAVFNQFPII
jgi:hypothetical protein